MLTERPLLVSHLILSSLGTRLFLHHGDRVPPEGPILLVSNHRSFMDAPLLMVATNRSIRFACHHYMSQVPVMREVVTQLGCLPLDKPEHRQRRFFIQATQLLQQRQIVGIFPEGTPPMVKVTPAQTVGGFQRGFMHLALRAEVPELAILPVAIAAAEETCRLVAPLKLLSWFDPSEPLFRQEGWHPMVIYQRVNVLVGHPRWLTSEERQSYQGRAAKSLVNELSNHCREEIKQLLHQSYAERS